MKNQILVSALILLSLSFVFAIYAGECDTIEFPNTDDVEWTVTGNSSDIEGFSFTKNGTIITYCFDVMFKQDNFTLTFYNYQQVTVDAGTSSSRGGSGGGCTYNKNYDWNCSEWGECIDETQIRICKNRNNCGNFYGKPNETQFCLVPIIQNDTDVDDTNVDEPEPVESEWLWIEITFFILLIVCGLFLLIYTLRKEIKKLINKLKILKKKKTIWEKLAER